MDDFEQTILLLDNLITDREEHFQHALSESAEQSLITYLKNDIDFLKEKRKQIIEELFDVKNKISI